MALEPVRPVIEQSVKDMLNNNPGAVDSGDPTASIDFYAAELTTIIIDAIKAGTVTVAAGIPVATAGSPTAQTGVTTGPGTGTIS